MTRNKANHYHQAQEPGLNYCENPWQGSFIVDELTDLMEAGKYCPLGSMSHALYEVGGEYRRNM